MARPGGNITGFSSFMVELAAKRFEVLRELIPGVSRVGVLMNMSNASLAAQWDETHRAARALGVEAQLIDVRRADDFVGAFETATRWRANALLVAQDGLMQENGKRIVALAAKHRMPVLYAASEQVDEGGLMSLGVSYPELYRRAAGYVGKIMHGTKPGELPFEQPTRVEIVINLRTAKSLGIDVPKPLLLRADRVVD
jgi:putative ABC transport system substrate-binding protein